MNNIKRGSGNFNNNFSQRRPIPRRVPMRRTIQGMPMKRPPFPGQNLHTPDARIPVNKNLKKVSNKLWIFAGVGLILIIILILTIVLIAKNSEVDIDKKQLDMKIENVKLEEESVQVDLKVDPKEEAIVGIKFILETEEDYEVFKEDVSISKITEKKFTFKLKEINGKKITRISVSPIFENKKGEEVLGYVEDDYFIEALENLSEEEYPNSFYDDYNDYDYYEYYEQEYSDEYSEYWNYENETSLSNETNNNQNNNSNNNQTNYSNINYPNESASFCGDNVVDTGEYCDSNNFAGETCESLGYSSGILGCRKTCEFDTRYCVEKTPINNSPPVNNTPNPPVNCVSYYYSQCYNNDVYWYNSCGVRENVKEDCFSDEDCIDGECVIKQTTPICNSNSYFQCYNGDVYWYNSCGVRETMREDCTSSETCTNGECVITTYSCSGSNTRTCSIINGAGTQSATCNTTVGQWVWGTCIVTSCNNGYQINENTCVKSSTNPSEAPNPSNYDEIINNPNFKVLYKNNFEQRPLGKYATLSEFNKDWQSASWGNRGYDFEVVSDPTGGNNKAGMFTYPYYDSKDFKWICWGDGCSDSDGKRILFDEMTSFGTGKTMLNGVGPSSGGGQWLVNLHGSYNEVYVSYNVRFEPDFDAVSGGKMIGGLAPKKDICPSCDDTDCIWENGTKCKNPPCDGIADDFSVRYMFHKEHLSYYFYFYGKKNTCGDSVAIAGSEKVYDGNWHNLIFRFKLNNAGSVNSIAETWIDGIKTTSWNGLEFRKGKNSFGIEALRISTFYGGNSKTRCEKTSSWDYMCKKGSIDSWIKPHYESCAIDPSDPCSDIIKYSDGTPKYLFAPRKTEYVYIDDLVVYTSA